MEKLNIGIVKNENNKEYNIINIFYNGNDNVALLYDYEEDTYITVRQIDKNYNGKVSWVWGNYFNNDFDSAILNYLERKNKITKKN